MAKPKRGEVWLVDLGMKAKTRPCVVLSVAPSGTDRDLAALVGHTTNVTGSQFEAVVPCPFLQAGAFGCQDIYTVARASNAFLRLLGVLNANQLSQVEEGVKRWLGLAGSKP